MEDQEYIFVNSVLNEYFFQGRFEMLPIYLDLEGDAEDRVAAGLGIEAEELGDFIGLTAARSLRFDKSDPYCDQAQWLREWSITGRRDPPPFTTLLCALSIAAERMGADENFSPNNYSERLFELLGARDSTSQQKLRQFAKSTRQFWRAMNMWLSENDYQLGRPTARAVIGHWKYASFGLSQALVRDGDRKRFTGLFAKYDMVPREPIPEAEMTLLVHDWMSSHGPTGPSIWLKKLWQSNDLRPRVVSAALDAFEAWEEIPDGMRSGPRKTRMQWQIGFTGFPKKEARFALVVARGGFSERLTDPSGGDQNETQLFLEDGMEPEVQCLGPVGSINLDLLLLRSQSFVGDESGTNYDYVAKPIVTLARTADGVTFREVSRVSLFEEHIIFCHEAWLDRVKGHLSGCARSGYSTLSASDMRGVPEGWYILRGVEIIRAIENANDNFHALNPIASAAAISCADGMKLGHGTWHVDAPPLVEATSEKSGSTLEILREEFGKPDKVVAKEKAVGDYVEANLVNAELEAGTNLRAVVKNKSTELAESSFSLRSADIPRPLGSRRLIHEFHNHRFALEPTGITSSHSAFLEGCIFVGGQNETEFGQLPDAPIEAREIPDGSIEETADWEWSHSNSAGETASESCVIRGHHHWIYEAFEKGDDKYDAKMAECKNCRVKALSRTREVARGNARKMSQNQVLIPARRVAKVHFDATSHSQIGQGGVSPDIVFDGLCYLGQGSWPTFQRLSSNLSSEPWFAQSFASELFSLGFLEMQGRLDGLGGAWSVPPPALILDGNGNGFFSGFGSSQLFETLNVALMENGAVYAPQKTPGKPSIHRWSNLPETNLEALLASINDAHGRKISVPHNLAKTLCTNLPSFVELHRQAQPVHVEQLDGLAKFDPQRARWLRAERVDELGAYKIGLHGTRYVFKDGGGTLRQVGHQVAKTLAAGAEGCRLHGYDTTAKRFTAALGAEPPWLFGRALVASSGSLPNIEGGRLIYEQVDPQVASLILQKMYEGSESIG